MKTVMYINGHKEKRAGNGAGRESQISFFALIFRECHDYLIIKKQAMNGTLKNTTSTTKRTEKAFELQTSDKYPVHLIFDCNKDNQTDHESI